ncbi:MAG: exodeoxyribonuclease VII large subunit [Alphaproteobacteria bacterium RIFCSPHIGHO2_12_FULL_63_12]|nr:MAG: exodeoxyribonuclease VII large subunit [Alphaproteobacteria bacterium RIFCSPHIGHO2_12_FULL_63_12]
MTGPSSGNLPEYSVSELAGAVKRVIEDGFGFVRVKGELGRVTRAASGHLYLDLKDENATISGVIWKGNAQRLRFSPEQGMEVAATGKLTTFPGQSKYQIVIDSLEPAGAGALMAVLEERKKKLAAEGLFDAARKRPIPFLPEVIGVVTSPSGAVIRDILHRLRDRFPRHVIVWPTLVQGKGAEAQIAAAIEGFNALPEGGDIPRPDVLIVARGGGSLEDLWCFNEEIVVRAAAASRIPLISAVGHETDTTLIDYASDLRAPTPSAAAEKAVPMRSELVAEVLNKHRRMIEAQARRLREQGLRLRSATRGLGRPEDATGAKGQKLDFLASRLSSALRARSDKAARAFAGAGARFGPRALSAGFARREASLESLGKRMGRERLHLKLRDCGVALGRDGARLQSLAARLLKRPGERLAASGGLLRSLSYKSVLDRGFALVKMADGKLARRAATLPASGAVALVFADGERAAHLGDAPKKPAVVKKPVQKGLFD